MLCDIIFFSSLIFRESASSFLLISVTSSSSFGDIPAFNSCRLALLFCRFEILPSICFCFFAPDPPLIVPWALDRPTPAPISPPTACPPLPNMPPKNDPELAFSMLFVNK